MRNQYSLKTPNLIFILIIISFTKVYSQKESESNGNIPSRYFQKYFGGEEGIGCEAVSIVKIKDSYYILGNYDSRPNYSFSDANTDVVILKLDSNGDLVEIKKMGNNQREIAHSIIEINGKLFVSGITFTEQRKFMDDVFLVQFDTSLNKTSELFLGEPDDDAGVVYMGKSINSFFLSYRITSGNVVDKFYDGGDVWSSDKGMLSFFDEKMKQKWTFYHTTPLVMITSTQNINNDYFCFGVGDLNNRSMYAMKINEAGKVLFQKSLTPTIGKMNNASLPKSVTLSDGNLLIFAEVIRNSNIDIMIFKMDLLGNIIWSKVIGSNNDEKLREAVLNPYEKDGIVLVGSTSNSNYGKDDGLLIFIDKNGEVRSSMVYGGTDNDVINSIIVDFPFGFAACGASLSRKNGSKDVVSEMWFLKLSKDGSSFNENSCSKQISLNSQSIRLSSDISETKTGVTH